MTKKYMTISIERWLGEYISKVLANMKAINPKINTTDAIAYAFYTWGNVKSFPKKYNYVVPGHDEFLDKFEELTEELTEQSSLDNEGDHTANNSGTN